MDSGRFGGKVVVITGAGSGIGAAAARRFWNEGAAVVLVGRTEAKLAKVAQGLDQERCLIQVADVAKPEDVDRLISSTAARFGAIDVLVNNAGVAGVGGFRDKPDSDWHEVMSVNFYSAVLLTKLVSQAMIAQGAGKVINISSIAGKEGTPHHIAYTASKHALIGFTKCAARELIGHGIAVNAVCPGLVDTRMLRTFFERLGQQTGASPDHELQAMIAKTPRREIGDAADVAHLVAFLASSGARNIVGQAINTDGGLLQW